MKVWLACFAGLSFLQAASAQPHRRHGHRLYHAKKDVVTVIETYFAEGTASPQVIIFVDQFGKPVSTVIGTASTNIDRASTVTSLLGTFTSTAPIFTTSSAALSIGSPVAEPTPSAALVISSSGYGLAYSPYNRDGSCKNAAQVTSDFALFEEYSLIRTYGTDCDTIEIVYAACKTTGKKLFAGIFTLSGLTDEVATLIAGVGGDWSSIHTISVGNELVDQGQASAADVMTGVSAARELLRAAGYQGPVVTVDTLAATLRPGNTVLCDESDYCAVNAHPFFDNTATAAGAGQWLKQNVETLRSKLAAPSQKIVVTETGWPSQASANGAAVASPQLQKAAIDSIKGEFSSDPLGVILLSAFNRQWLKGDTGQFGQEYWFGIMGDCPSG